MFPPRELIMGWNATSLAKKLLHESSCWCEPGLVLVVWITSSQKDRNCHHKQQSHLDAQSVVMTNTMPSPVQGWFAQILPQTCSYESRSAHFDQDFSAGFRAGLTPARRQVVRGGAGLRRSSLLFFGARRLRGGLFRFVLGHGGTSGPYFVSFSTTAGPTRFISFCFRPRRD